MARHPIRKIADEDVVNASRLLRRVIPALQENIDIVAQRGNGSVAYEKCQLAIRELFEVLAMTDETYGDGYPEKSMGSSTPK